jgi:hypothetical protein
LKEFSKVLLQGGKNFPQLRKQEVMTSVTVPKELKNFLTGK